MSSVYCCNNGLKNSRLDDVEDDAEVDNVLTIVIFQFSSLKSFTSLTLTISEPPIAIHGRTSIMCLRGKSFSHIGVPISVPFNVDTSS